MNKITHYVATVQCNNTNKYLSPSNLVPHEWYTKITDDKGNPDFLAIILLSDIVGWFRTLKTKQTIHNNAELPKLVGNSLVTGYEYFQNKLQVSRERIRKAFVQLEKLNCAFRTTKNIVLNDGSRINKLFLTIDQTFFKSCFRNPDLDIRVGSKHLTMPSPQNQGYLISKKNLKEKDRSIKSNFIENNPEEKRENRVGDSKTINSMEKLATKEVSRIKQNSNPALRRKPKQLGDFYPLTQEDCSILQSTSGREFSLNAMNEILADMSKRLTDRIFFGKKSFLSYMAKAFQHEMRDSVKISNENFKIRSNKSELEKEKEEQEQYLAEIENTLQVSPEWHLKKKLVCVLKPDKAYQLLKSCKRMETGREGSIFQIHLERYVELSQLEKEIILNQVKATHEKLEDGEFKAIEAIEFLMPEKARNNDLKTTTAKNSKLPEGIWGKIRSVLIEYNGESGQAIDIHWISKLDAEIDENKKRIKLHAPSDLIKDWIQSNYQQTIDLLARNSGFELEGLSC